MYYSSFSLLFLVFHITIESITCSSASYQELHYNSLEKIELRLHDIASLSPGFIRLDSIGKTYANNDIWQITFSKSLSINKSTIWIDCGMQARDWITHSTCMYIIDSISKHLLKKEINSDVEYLLDHYELTIVPVVNPDGYIKSWEQYNRSWIKNISPGSLCDGVFISQNFPFKFGYYYSNRNQCDEDYIGPSPTSEEETKAIITSLEALHTSNGVFALFHMESSGQKWSYPWSYTAISSPTEQSLEAFCQVGTAAIEKITNRKYKCGQSSDMDKIRGGTFIDYAHSSIGISTVYSLALRAGDYLSAYDVPENEIKDTGREIFGGIVATVSGKSKELECIDGSFNNEEYNDFGEIEHHLKCIERTLENKVKMESIGMTFEQNDIWMMTFSENFNLEQEVVWLDCGMQAREWLTHSTCIYIIDAVAKHFIDEKDPLLTDLFRRFDLVVIPVINPDGYITSWKPYNRNWNKNTNEDGGICHGVYISQNFPYMFSFPYSNINECDEDYIGSRPASEPETNAIINTLEILRQRLFIIFHLESNGQQWMYPWSYRNEPSQFIDCLEVNCQEGVKAIYLETGKQYSCLQVSSDDGTRGGSFVDYVHNHLELSLVYSLDIRSGSDLPYDVPIKEIAGTGKEILKGILAAVDYAVTYPCNTVPTMRPPPIIPGPPEE